MTLNVHPAAVPYLDHNAPLNIVSITDYGAIPNDSSLAAKEANNAAFTAALDFARSIDGNNLGGGAQIYVPPGNWYISQTIDMSLTWGASIIGFGCRVATYAGPTTVYQGSWIFWAGAVDETMIDFRSSHDSALINVGFNGDGGGNVAGTGIRFAGTGVALINCKVEGCYVYNVTGVPGYGIHVGNSPSQTSNSEISNCVISDCVEGLFQEYSQTNILVYRNILFQSYTTYGAHIDGGDATFYDCNWQGGATHTADVYVEDSALWCRFVHSYHETSQPAYKFESGTARTHFTEFVGCRVLFFSTDPAAKIIDYQSTSPVTCTSCQWGVYQVGVNFGIVDWAGVGGGSPPVVIEIGCQYFNGANQNVGGGVYYTAISTHPGAGNAITSPMAICKAFGGGYTWTLEGDGTPEGVVTAPIGSLYTRADGGAGTCLYIKETAPTPSTGWVPK